MRRLKRVATGALSAFLLAALPAGLATTAAAKPVFNEKVGESFTEQLDCGNGLVLEVTTTGQSRVLINGRGPDGTLFFAENESRTVVMTNPATGKTYTIDSRFRDQDNSVVDNLDGTFTVVLQLNGRIQHRGPDGRHLFTAAGQLVFEVVFADDGTELSRELVKSVGTPAGADDPDCADLHGLLT